MSAKPSPLKAVLTRSRRDLSVIVELLDMALTDPAGFSKCDSVSGLALRIEEIADRIWDATDEEDSK